MSSNNFPALFSDSVQFYQVSSGAAVMFFMFTSKGTLPRLGDGNSGGFNMYWQKHTARIWVRAGAGGGGRESTWLV